MFTVRRHTVGDVEILVCSGHITLDEGSRMFRDALQSITPVQDKIVVNLRMVSYIDASGIGELVSAYTRLTNQGAQLRLCDVPPRITDLLQITKLYTVFEIYESEKAAVMSF